MPTVQSTVQEQNEIKRFAPPDVRIGQLVNWHPGGDKSMSPHVGIVTKVGQKALGICTFTSGSFGRYHPSVRHVDDPDLSNKHIAASGAWDFTADWYEQRAWRADVDAKLAALASRPAASAAVAPASPGSVRSLRDQIRNQVREQGGD